MNHRDLQNILHTGEDSQRQFKQEISHADSLAAEQLAQHLIEPSKQ